MKHYYFFLLIGLLAACSPKVVTAPTAEKQTRPMALRPVLIYQTRGDYADLVPILLDESGTRVVSYPAPTDIHPDQRPVDLGDGWYLDRRGVGIRSAFTSYTYSEYAALPAVPTEAELLSHIVDSDGITALYHCGTKSLTTDELKALVRGGFQGCKRLK